MKDSTNPGAEPQNIQDRYYNFDARDRLRLKQIMREFIAGDDAELARYGKFALQDFDRVDAWELDQAAPQAEARADKLIKRIQAGAAADKVTHKAVRQAGKALKRIARLPNLTA